MIRILLVFALYLERQNTELRNWGSMLVKSDCGAVDLLSAIFGFDKEIQRYLHGLPCKKVFVCLNCEKFVVKVTKRGFCSLGCAREYKKIPIECAGCGKIFKRSGKAIIYHLNHPQAGNNKIQERFFHSRQCRGKFARKWDWTQVYQLKDDLGYNGARISRALNIPLSTVSVILSRRSKCLSGRKPY